MRQSSCSRSLKNSPLIPPARIALSLIASERSSVAIAFSRLYETCFSNEFGAGASRRTCGGGEHGVIAGEYQNALLVSVSRSYCPEKSRYAGRFIRLSDSVVGLRHQSSKRKSETGNEKERERERKRRERRREARWHRVIGRPFST